MVLLFVYFLVASGVSFLCSLWEAVLLSITPAYTQIKVREGDPIGQTLLEFKDNIDRPLAAILTLNTIAHTVGAIGVGQQATVLWGESSPWITGLLVPVLVTLGILILSELIPKTLGATYWQSLTTFTVRSLSWVIRLLSPLIAMSQLITKSLKREDGAKVFSRRDFLAMADIGAREGVFEPLERDLITNMLAFREVKAHDAMTPRTVIRSLSGSLSLSEFLAVESELVFSRLPLFEDEEKEKITGYVLRTDLLRAARNADAGDRRLSEFQRPLDFVLEDYPITQLLSRFLARREHMAVVLDDYGGLSGLITMEDVIETLLGLEIVDESDTAADMQAIARRNWEERAEQHGLLLEMPKIFPTSGDDNAQKDAPATAADADPGQQVDKPTQARSD